MEAIKFDRIESLDKSKMDWKIKARVTRMWATISPESGITKGFNLILLDDDNQHVHAFAYADVWGSIGRNVFEGGVYIVSTFAVRDTGGSLKHVSNDKSLRFTNSTNFESVKDDFMIPQHKFEFLDLGDLLNEASRYQPSENPEFATDVIGVVEEYERLRKIGTKFGDRDIVRFKICDSRNRHRVGVWGELAKTVDNDYDQDLEKPIIVIITSTKLSTYNNSVQISTMPSSKVYFNLNDECVMEMRQRLEDDGYKSSQQGNESNYDLTIVPATLQISLQDLIQNPFDNLKKKLFCTYTIAKVEETNSWYNYHCHKCKNEVLCIENKFKCDRCIRHMPLAEKRFCVKVTAEDDSISCYVFLLDRVVKQMIGTTASNLYLESLKVPAKAAIVLNDVVGKMVTTTIDVIDLKNEHDRFAYHAVDMYASPLAIAAMSEFSPPPEFPSINLTDSFDDVEVAKTPGSAKSVNKKIKMEK